MKKILVLSGLLLVAAFSCDKGDGFEHELLAGDWSMKDSPFPYFTPTISFSDDGRYTQTNIAFLVQFISPAYIQYTITGDFVFRDGKITFTTGSVHDAGEADDYPYGYEDIAVIQGSSLGYTGHQ